MKPYLLLLFSSLLLVPCVVLQGQQANNRITGNYENCITWQDQSQVGKLPIQVISGTTIALKKNHSTYQSISLADATSAIDLGNNYLDVSSTQGSMNMEACDITFISQDNSTCVSLWGSDNLNWPFAESFGNGPVTVNREMVVIKIPEHYRIDRIFTRLSATIANGDYSRQGCWGDQFYIEANFMKNGVRVGGPYVILNRQNNVLSSRDYPNCITNSPRNISLESKEYNFGQDIDLGYCNTGDVISVSFTTSRDRSSGCTGAPLGMMQGYVKFGITQRPK